MVHNTTSMMRLVNQGMREWGIALHGVGRTVEEARANIERAYQFPQIAYMSCGNRWKLASMNDVPLKNTPCPCGNPKHWMVVYEIIRPTIKERILTFIRGAGRLLASRS